MMGIVSSPFFSGLKWALGSGWDECDEHDQRFENLWYFRSRIQPEQIENQQKAELDAEWGDHESGTVGIHYLQTLKKQQFMQKASMELLLD